MWPRIAVALCVALAILRFVPPARAQIDAMQVREAIDRGVAYLMREQNREKGSWPDHPGLPGGVTGLCTLALLYAGVEVDHPQMQAALNYLRKQKPSMTYSAALQTMVFCAAEPKRDLLLIRRNVLWLEQQQVRSGNKKGAWGYSGTQGSGDNSNTQFALLALHEAERAGVPVSEQVWRLSKDYWERTQNIDGSWGYLEGHPGTGSMTCAGIATLVMAAEKLDPGDAQVDGERVRCCGQQQENLAVERALNWLGRAFTVHSNPTSRGGRAGQTWLLYYLYGVERVGRITNQRLIGGHDWYREGADLLVRNQEKLSGFWKGVGHGEDNPRVATALALLFLAKGRRPILVAKLKHEPLDDWNHHRHDLANLTSYVEQRWQRNLTWQVVDLRNATADDLAEAPVLFLSGQSTPQFTDQQVRKLREYIDQGGFLFAEACSDGDQFDTGFRELVERMFPEPEYKLRLLEPEHPVWTVEEPVDPQYVRPLWGVQTGCRTSVVYCPENLGCYWELDPVGRKTQYADVVEQQIAAAKSIGINVLAYATNREVQYKLEIPRTIDGQGPRDEFERAKLYIAKLRHSGGWNAAPSALANLMKAVSREAGLRVSTDQRSLAISDPKLFGYHMVFMHGRNSFRLSDAERKQLKTYIERGGMLFADAICSSRDFTTAFRREMALLFPDNPLEAIPTDHPMFSSEYGGFDLGKVTRREPKRRTPGGPLQANLRKVDPELEGIRLDNRYAIIFSPYDLSCALERHESLECPGYTREDAARIGLNVVLYSLHE